jgi:hypothetical protein
MQVVTVLGVMMLVLGTLATALGMSPLGTGEATAEVDPDAAFSTQAAETTFGKIGGMHEGIINDLVAIRENPDLALAESPRDQMSAYAQTLALQFDGLATTLQARLDEAQAALPPAPANLVATAGVGLVALDWSDVAVTLLDGYHVYRSEAANGPYARVASGVTGSAHLDGDVSARVTYHYLVTAVDQDGNESGPSNGASATLLN